MNGLVSPVSGPGISQANTYYGLDTRVGSTTNSVARTYLRDGAYVTDPVLSDGEATYTPGISERRGSTTTFLHSGLKNASSQTTTSQTVGASRVYDAFGGVVSSSGNWKGPFGYAGGFGYQEDSAGLKLLGHRYYDPSVGRFLTRDPIKDGRNWYGYCENDPLGCVDPTGLLTLAGDTHGLIAMVAWLAPGNWSSYNGLSKFEVLFLIIDSDDEDLGIWGHGKIGEISYAYGQYLKQKDIELIIKVRRAWGKRPYRTITVNQCEVLASPGMLNKLLELGKEVNGFCGYTVKTPRKRFTSPVSAGDTRLQEGGWFGVKTPTKAGKVWSK